MLMGCFGKGEKETDRQTDRQESGCCRINYQRTQVFIPVQALEVSLSDLSHARAYNRATAIKGQDIHPAILEPTDRALLRIST